jgi:putative alpha-1,2-mannosidase
MNPERQDAPSPPLYPATHFSGYFCARFDTPFTEWGTTTHNDTLNSGASYGHGPELSAYVRFGDTQRGKTVITVRVGVSFISIDQARLNLDNEVPDGSRLEDTATNTRALWKDKLDRVAIEGASLEDKETFYTALYHTLQVRLANASKFLFFDDVSNPVSK